MSLKGKAKVIGIKEDKTPEDFYNSGFIFGVSAERKRTKFKVAELKKRIEELKELIDVYEARIIPNLCVTCVGGKKGTCREVVKKNFKELNKKIKEVK